jgi:2-dehydro-3-deoxyphosphogluconate aldolase/(4S)-4-hydroxy-2-oxoglutarate aldolase
MRAEEVFSLSPVMPVVVIDDPGHASPLAGALGAGGLRTIEVTLRTPAALECIRIMSHQAQGVVIGAGTVLSIADLEAAIEAGASYALSPGATPALMAYAREAPIPFIPGIATASELMLGLEMGYRCFKFFPAENLGGVAMLKAFHSPLPSAKFCPTGGIGPDAVEKYLALENVMCVGGSWVTPAAKMKAGDWTGIEALARQAAGYRKR